MSSSCSCPPPAQISYNVIAGGRLPIPAREELPDRGGGFSALDDYVALIHSCWATDPAERPSFKDLIPRLRALGAAAAAALQQERGRGGGAASKAAAPLEPAAAGLAAVLAEEEADGEVAAAPIPLGKRRSARHFVAAAAEEAGGPAPAPPGSGGDSCAAVGGQQAGDAEPSLSPFAEAAREASPSGSVPAGEQPAMQQPTASQQLVELWQQAGVSGEKRQA